MEEITEIKAWKTSDGRLFEDCIEAKNEQDKINLKKDLIYCLSYSINFAYEEELLNFIFENRRALRDVLNKHIKE